MQITELNRARRKLALKIVEYVSEILTTRYDSEPLIHTYEIAKGIACLIPDTRAEAQAEMDALNETLDAAMAGPLRANPFAELRALLGLDGCSIATVHKSAVLAVKESIELRGRLRLRAVDDRELQAEVERLKGALEYTGDHYRKAQRGEIKCRDCAHVMKPAALSNDWCRCGRNSNHRAVGAMKTCDHARETKNP